MLARPHLGLAARWACPVELRWNQRHLGMSHYGSQTRTVARAVRWYYPVVPRVDAEETVVSSACTPGTHQARLAVMWLSPLDPALEGEVVAEL